MVARRYWSCASSEAGTFRFQNDSNGVYYSGVGGMKVSLMLAELNGFLKWRPALAVVSPHRRGYLIRNPNQPDCLMVETAFLSQNFSPPAPHAWG
jgi:hypothetical protein